MKPDTCPHGDKNWRCPVCCLAELRRNHPRLRAAVRQAEKGNGGARSVFGSRVPAGFGTAAFSLLQDIFAAGGLDTVEQQLNTFRDPARLTQLRKHVRQWRSRSSLILHDAEAPYPLAWDTTVTGKDGQPKVVTRNIPCPVVSDDGECGVQLMVHRDNDPTSPDYGKPAVIRCKHSDDHEWELRSGGWLRLGVLLGGVA